MIKIGTAGYDHDEWQRVFYPSNIKENERLEFYSSYFNIVEISASFYNMPNKWMFVNMLEKVPPNFEFIVTVPRSITYNRERQQLAEFKDAIQPLLNDERLGCVVLKFPYSFEVNQENLDFILDINGVLNLPTVIEFKHPKWMEETGLKFCEDNKLAISCSDEPRPRNAPIPEPKVTSSIGYLKFNGRNADAWFKNRPRNEKYDYLYSEQELQEWLPKIKVLSGITKKFYIIFSNFTDAKAVKNAAMLSKHLGHEINLPKPEEHDSHLSKFL